MNRRDWLAGVLTSVMAPAAAMAAPGGPVVGKLRVTVLDTMVADSGGQDGEWGFAALIDADGRRLLYDTGASPGMVLHNVRRMGIDLADVEDVILSHCHGDHTEGLLTLRETFAAKNPKALSRCHVGAGFFAAREDGAGHPFTQINELTAAYEKLGGTFVVHDGPVALAPGVWFSGPVPRKYNERNWNPGGFLKTATGPVDDNLPEDSALMINTAEGTVVVTGCGHAGVMNICERAHDMLGPQPIACVIGGLHLFQNSQASIEATGARLKALGVRKVLAAHCTGFEATWILRRMLDAGPADVAVATVGAQYVSGVGIQTGALARLGTRS